MIRFLTAFAFLIHFASLASIPGRSSQADVVHYEIRLDVLDFTTKVVHGKTTVTFTATTSSMDTLNLELRSLGIDSVLFAGQPLSAYTHVDDHVQVILPQAVAPGDTASLMMFYHGVPYHESWGGFHFSGQYAFNLGVGFVSYPPNLGKAWFPCVDNFFDRALFDCHIRVEDDKTAVCGGLLQSVTPHGDGTHTFHWQSQYTIPTYLASFAIGDYVAVNDTFQGAERDVPITIYVRPADEGKVAGSFSNLHSILEGFETRFGPYPFERVGYTGTALGAMEHACNVAYPQSLINNTPEYEWLYAHEIAHMWFGNKVTCAGPGEMWLNEGWAVWTELLYREDLYGHQTALDEQRKKHRDVLQFLHTPQGDGDYYALYDIPPAYVYGKTVYQKGGLVVQTLRHYLGDDLFFPAVQFYLDTFAYRHASTYDLRDALSQHSRVDLTGFFDSWVFQPGFPNYSIDSFNVTDAGTEVFVRQREKGRDFLGDACIVEITFMDENRHVYSDTMIFNGLTGSKIFNPSFTPAIAMMDYYEKIAHAATVRAKTIGTTGSVTFDDTFSSLNVYAVQDSAFVRITHNWVPPDSLKNPQPGLRISDYRHWHVDGIIPAGFDAGINFIYQRSGALDNNLITNPADSLVILYRAKTADDWEGIPFERFGAWQAGQIRVDTLRTGEYTLAVWDAQFVGMNETTSATRPVFNCFPNPANGKVTFNWDFPDASLIRIADTSGRLVQELSVKKSRQMFEWNAGHLAPGVYLVSLFGTNNKPLATAKLLLKSSE